MLSVMIWVTESVSKGCWRHEAVHLEALKCKRNRLVTVWQYWFSGVSQGQKILPKQHQKLRSSSSPMNVLNFFF